MRIDLEFCCLSVMDGLIGIGFDFVRFRSLQNEVEELEELHERRDRFYEAKRVEMKEFKEVAEKFVVKCRMEVESLRNRVNEVTDLMEPFCCSSLQCVTSIDLMIV